MLLMYFTETKSIDQKGVWFLDSGCSNHMCGIKDWFFDFDDKFKESVKLGDNSRMAIKGKDNIKLKIEGITQVITDVFYIPELKNNLLSIDQLQQRNLTIVFKQDMCKVFHNARGLIMSSKMSANRMFAIAAQVTVPSCLQMESEGSTYLWHCRYGYLSIKGLKIIAQKEMVRGLLKLQESSQVCTDCMVGKQHREVIPKESSWRASQRLELIHFDICGPINLESNSNKKYFITFIDDYSRKSWVYFMSEKFVALDIFKKFKIMVEKDSGNSIFCLRTDKGGEFNSCEFNSFCSNNGIKRQLTAAYTPLQNGFAERKNRTIMNMVRSMLSEKGVPKQFWPEALKWKIYVLNRSPTLAVKNVTPEEAWNGTKPSVKHFRVFGCIAYAHVPDAQRKKLDDKSIKCVHLGVSEESKAYKLYDPITKKVIVSKDVIFAEKEKWKWNKEEIGEKKNLAECKDDNESSEGENAEIEATQNTNNENAESEDQNPQAADSPNPAEGRTRRQPAWLEDYVTIDDLHNLDYVITDDLHNLAIFSTAEDPNTCEEAVQNNVWRKAMDVEIEAIERNNTWELTDLPSGVKTIGVKWIYKTKCNEDGKVEKYKARLVAKGYTQQQGIDYKEAFAPIARWDTIRTILALVAVKGCKG